MQRRTVLQALGVGATSLLAGCGGKVSEIMPNSEPKPSKEFGFGSSGFERVEWTENNKLAVTVSQDHDMDGLGVRYHSKDSIEDDIVVSKAPEYGGTVTLNFFGHAANSGGTPPAGKYNIVAYKGSFGGFNIAQETIGKVSFQIQPELEVVTASVTSQGRLSLQLRNKGNAPTYIQSANVNGQSHPIKNFVRYEGSALMTSADTGFLQGDCVKVPDELNLRLNTIPSLEIETTTETRDNVPNSCS